MICPICGWSDEIRKNCATAEVARFCPLNRANVQNYLLRNKSEAADPPEFVRNSRYQGADAKGDSFNRFARLTEADVVAALAAPLHSANRSSFRGVDNAKKLAILDGGTEFV